MTDNGREQKQLWIMLLPKGRHPYSPDPIVNFGTKNLLNAAISSGSPFLSDPALGVSFFAEIPGNGLNCERTESH
jgi:hypothetical protein